MRAMITRPRLLTLAAAALGAAMFLALALPLPLLLGPMLGCLLAALAGAPLQGMGVLGTALRTWLGVAIGSTVTPALLHDLPRMGATLALVPLFVGLIGLVGYPFFRRVMGYDHPTAFYSAMPGGLQDMLIFGEEAGGNVRSMSLIHATRVLVIVTATPFLLALLYDVDLSQAPGRPASEVPLSQIALMVASGIAGWKIAERIGMFGASILGPLILTACLSLAGVIQGRPPAEMIWAAQFFIGIAVGSKYAGITPRELRHDVTAGLGYALLLAILSLGFIETAALLSGRPALEVALSFLPGGQAEMAVIALMTGADVAFVVAHHLTRIFLVITAAPLIARWMARR
ncbi:AbrB family transcriptional regulator [Gemmobacter lutimaris]|uniref:AbrB family transcriptional regulator n=1 Tax=Gemmobacter lutimaris TaxID=2306023 RepID=A0A398BJD7_9RHOB|nr:AbrB family transcriptional regulator [Gemmobacter lutimaris]RID90625.1 AbrB family transcriptional regulator [Gemmobacter lutimaris]